jgi:hypothetical protein
MSSLGSDERKDEYGDMQSDSSLQDWMVWFSSDVIRNIMPVGI